MPSAVQYEWSSGRSQVVAHGLSCFGHREISCRIFPEKALLFIEEIFLVQLDRKMRISAETASVQRLLGPADVAKWLPVSSGWVRDHATRKEPRLKSVKVGKLLRFRPEDVEDFLRTAAGANGNREPSIALQGVGEVTTA